MPLDTILAGLVNETEGPTLPPSPCRTLSFVPPLHLPTLSLYLYHLNAAVGFLKVLGEMGWVLSFYSVPNTKHSAYSIIEIQ